MKKIDAFKCEFTGSIYEDEARAVRSEFTAMMKSVAGSLPSMGSIDSKSIMEWLAGHITSEIYPTVGQRLIKALDYYEKNRTRTDVAAPQSEENSA